MKSFLSTAAFVALCAGAANAATVNVTYSSGMPGISGSLDVVETETSSGGIYDVTNNTGGSLLAFGVSNNSGFASIFDPDGFASDFGCKGAYCYDAQVITAADWNSGAFFDEGVGEEVSFQDIFGDFADVADGDSQFNWFTAQDGDLLDGQTSTDFFGFLEATVASQIIGVSQNQNGVAAFTAGAATVPSQPMAPVPLPAAGWMLIAGVGGLVAAGRHKKA